MNLAKRVFYKIKYTIHKLLYWEYWPQEVVYAIIYPYYAWMAFRLRAAGFFVVANPHDGEMNFLCNIIQLQFMLSQNKILISY